MNSYETTTLVFSAIGVLVAIFTIFGGIMNFLLKHIIAPLSSSIEKLEIKMDKIAEKLDGKIEKNNEKLHYRIDNILLNRDADKKDDTNK